MTTPTPGGSPPVSPPATPADEPRTPPSPHFRALCPMDWLHWLMIFGGLACGMIGSALLTIRPELDVLGWMFGALFWAAGILLVYYSAARPASCFPIKQHRIQVTAGLYVLIGLVVLWEVREFGGTPEEWNSFFDVAFKCLVSAGFVGVSSALLNEHSQLELNPLKHGILLYEHKPYLDSTGRQVLVEEGGPVLARSGFSIEEQDNQEEQDPEEVEVEVGGTTPGKIKFFTTTAIDRYNWTREGQKFWLLGADTAIQGFRNAAKVEIRRISAQGFEEGDVEGWKHAADKSMTLWLKWRLVATDPRENKELVRKLGWAELDESGHVPWKKGIEFFEKYSDKLEAVLERVLEFEESPKLRHEPPEDSEELEVHELALLVKRTDSKTERKYGRKFVGEAVGIIDAIGPEEVEEAFDSAAAAKTFHEKTQDVPPEKLKLALVSQGRAELQMFEVSGLGEGAVFAVGDKGVLAAGAVGRRRKGRDHGAGSADSSSHGEAHK